MELFYINSKNVRLELTKWPYMYQSGSLLDYTKSYYTSGSQIIGFYSTVTEIPITIAISTDNERDYYSAVNRLYEITATDIEQNTPGKLYMNGQYMNCYIRSSKKSRWNMGVDFMLTELMVITDAPFWITEKKKSFLIDSSVTGEGYLDYPYDYSYDYMPSVSSNSIENPGYAPVDFRMIIYGPISNPAVTIGDTVYKINTNLLEDEYLVIDSREKLVEQVGIDGVSISKYNSRDKDYDIYKKIDPGHSLVSWAGFGFDVTLYIERSEPEWIL